MINDLRRILASKLLMWAFKVTPPNDINVRGSFGRVFLAMTEPEDWI